MTEDEVRDLAGKILKFENTDKVNKIDKQKLG